MATETGVIYAPQDETALIASSRRETVDDQAFSVQRTAKRLGVCERTTLTLIEKGELRAHRVGRQWRIFESALREYLARVAN
jgi:excisionase family DNA binding protein